MEFAALVRASGQVAATRSRNDKIATLAAIVGALHPDEVAVAVAMLIGEPRQGKIGVGWMTMMPLDVAPASQPTLTIGEVDGAFDAIAAVGGAGSAAARQRLLADLFGRATTDEQALIRRLLVGELRQGALAGVMTDAVARAAAVPVAAVRRAAMLTGSLPETAATAMGGGEASLAAVGLEVLRPVAPMLASTAADVASAIEAMGECSVEWKLDGARIGAHRRGSEVRLFTRNLNDVTARLPAVADVVAALPVRSVVLDGEVLGLDADERPGVFQDTMSSFGRHDASGPALTVVFFDCLHLDGVDLLDRPLRDRLAALQRAAGPWRIRGVVTADPDEGAAVLAQALAAGHEGVVVKAIEAAYEAGRRGQSWRKVKPVRTYDLVVLGVEWGHGRRQGWLSNLHLGARDPREPGRFVMVGKTFKGLTDALLTWQTQRLQSLAVSTEPFGIEVRPELVVEIALDGVQRSSRYPGGVALRFARVKRYREDKPPSEADTIDDLRALIGLEPLAD